MFIQTDPDVLEIMLGNAWHEVINGSFEVSEVPATTDASAATMQVFAFKERSTRGFIATTGFVGNIQAIRRKIPRQSK